MRSRRAGRCCHSLSIRRGTTTSEVIDLRPSRAQNRHSRGDDMTTFEQVAARYIDTWNETDPAARRMAIDQLWANDGRYVDPLAAVQGHAAIDATIAAVQL